MDQRVPVDDAARGAWTEIAQGARMSNHMLEAMPDPSNTSNFAQISAVYPWEKASDWHKAYLSSALEHLTLWSDFAAPLRFHPEHEVRFKARPAHTLARAALEAASQAVWMTAGGSAEECARRHLALIRWDYSELRKSKPDLQGKHRIDELDGTLLQRVAARFTNEDLRPPTHLSVFRGAAPIVDLDPDDVEAVWRAASGAAHGRPWAGLSLQHVIPLEEYEPGQFRTFRLPDTEPMTRALRMADTRAFTPDRGHGGG